jgi:23S rRNA G2445 N2-methylase RlmL
MKFRVMIGKGCIDIAKQEIKNLTGKRLVNGHFSTKDAVDGCRLCYCARSIRNVFLEVTEKKAAEYDEKLIRKIDGKIYVNFSGFSLNQRGYIAKDNPPNLTSDIAFLAVNEAELRKDQVILDPLCRGGKFLIEAAHMLNNVAPGRFISKFAFIGFRIFKKTDFNKMFKQWDKSRKNRLKIWGIDSYTGNIENARENLKKADVDAQLSCRSLDWMDHLFQRQSVDRIITMLPPGKHKSTDALYRELFYQAAYCLKQDSLMVVLSEREDIMKKYAEQMNFEITKIHELNSMKLFKLKPLF